jgi:hypothetical protein
MDAGRLLALGVVATVLTLALIGRPGQRPPVTPLAQAPGGAEPLRPPAKPAAAPPAADRPLESPDDLPPGPGREETFFACTACHGLAIVKAQGMSRERWDESLAWMVERHRMNKLDAADRALVLDYLAASFPPRARGRPNPFLNR